MQDTSTKERTNLSLSTETYDALQSLTKEIGRPTAKVIRALTLAPRDEVIALAKLGLKEVDRELAEQRAAIAKGRNLIKDKLSHLTPAQLEALIAQAEKLK